MPSESKSQQMFMGAELARKRAGKKTRTGMSEQQLVDFASTPRKGLPYKVKKAAGGIIPKMPKPPRQKIPRAPSIPSVPTIRASTTTMQGGGVVATCGKLKDHGGFKDLGIGR